MPSTPSRIRIALTGGALAAALVATACSSATAEQVAGSASHVHVGNQHVAQQATLHDNMRKLWEDHITWTRLFIVSAEAGAPDLDATVQRLLQNQTDIGNAITPFYGDAAGAQLTALLRNHILTAGDLITAAKAGDSDKVATIKDAWYANGDEIADFLASANPRNWPRAEMRQMMHDHLDNTLTEAVDHLNGNWSADVADYDKVHDQILEMADMLTTGIVAQFPRQF